MTSPTDVANGAINGHHNLEAPTFCSSNTELDTRVCGVMHKGTSLRAKTESHRKVSQSCLYPIISYSFSFWILFIRMFGAVIHSWSGRHSAKWRENQRQ